MVVMQMVVNQMLGTLNGSENILTAEQAPVIPFTERSHKWEILSTIIHSLCCFGSIISLDTEHVGEVRSSEGNKTRLIISE
jgi:hypothetical protein